MLLYYVVILRFIYFGNDSNDDLSQNSESTQWGWVLLIRIFT